MDPALTDTVTAHVRDGSSPDSSERLADRALKSRPLPVSSTPWGWFQRVAPMRRWVPPALAVLACAAVP